MRGFDGDSPQLKQVSCRLLFCGLACRYAHLTKTILFTFDIDCLLIQPLFSQKRAWDIYTINNEKIVGAYLNKIENDTLFIEQNRKAQLLQLDSIKTLKFQKTSYATLLGTIIGIMVGGFLAHEFGRKISINVKNPVVDILVPTGLGMALGGIAGYNVGNAVGGDKYYDLYRIKKEDKKIKLLLKLIQGE